MAMRGQRSTVLGTMAKNPYAVGRTKYHAGASFAPTRGKVDKTGYMERDARKRALQGYLNKKKAK